MALKFRYKQASGYIVSPEKKQENTQSTLKWNAGFHPHMNRSLNHIKTDYPVVTQHNLFMGMFRCTSSNWLLWGMAVSYPVNYPVV